MSTLVISRPPQFTDPWFAEIEQVWDELEASVNDIEGRVVTLEGQVGGAGVVTSISKSGSPLLVGDVTLSPSGSITLTQVGNDIAIGGGGVTDHGALTGLTDDDHPQYLLTDGTRACTGDFTVDGKYKNQSTESLILESQEDDGASAVGTIIDTANNLTTPGALLLSLRNFGSEILSIDKDGNLAFNEALTISSTSSLAFQIDSNNDESASFIWLNGSSAQVMALTENGDLNVASSIKIGAPGVGTEALDVVGNITLTGYLKSLSNLVFQVDSDDDESALFQWKDGLGNDIMTLDESGNLTTVGTIIGGSSPFKFKSLEADGASAVGYELDTDNALSTSGAKLLVIKNNGVEKFSIDKDGLASGNFVAVVPPSAGSTGINAALLAAHNAGGGIVQMLEGTYIITDALGFPTIGPINNVTLQGAGEGTVLEAHAGLGFSGGAAIKFGGTRVFSATSLNNIASGDTLVTFSTPSEAGSVQAGDWLFIYGNDQGSIRDYEMHEVASNGNGGTGEVGLKDHIIRTLTTVKTYVSRDNKNNIIKDFKLAFVVDTTTANGIDIHDGANNRVENVTVNDFGIVGVSEETAINIQVAFNTIVSNCRCSGNTSGGVWASNSVGTKILHNTLIKNCSYVEPDNSDIMVNLSSDCIIDGNISQNAVHGYGINLRGSGSGNIDRRITITNNNLRKFFFHGIRLESDYDILIRGNHIESEGTADANDGIRVEDSGRFNIEHNTIQNIGRGIFVIAIGTNIRNFSINNNLFERILGGEGITIQGNVGSGYDISYFTVKGNVLHKVAAPIGLYTLNVNNGIISGNSIDDNTGGAGARAIYIAGQNNIIAENNMTNLGGGVDAITLAAASGNNLVTNNMLNGYPISDAGSGNSLSNNMV